MSNDPTQSGGLLGLDPDLSMQLGLGLLAAGGRHLAGQSPVSDIQGAIGNYYGQKQAKAQLMQSQLAAQQAQMEMGLAQRYLTGQQPPGQMPQQPQAQPAPQPVQGAPMPALGAQAAPAGGAPMQPLAPSWLTPPSASQMNQIPIGGYDPNYYRGMAILQHKDQLATDKEIQDRQRAAAQEQYAPLLAKLQDVVKLDNPAKAVKADPSLQAAWGMYARQLGYDPMSDLNDANVRSALTVAHNQIAAPLNAPLLSPTARKIVTQGRLGSVIETDPITGEEKQVVAPEELKEVGGTNGPTYVRGSQAEGRQAFNATTAGTALMTDPTLEMEYQKWKVNPNAPSGFARNPMMQAKLQNYIAQRSRQDGYGVGDAMAAGQDLKATGNAVNEFNSTKPGTAGGKLVAVNTAVAHLDALTPLIDAMQSGNLTMLNKARQFYEKQTGQPAPTNYDALAHMAVGEVTTAINANGGTGSERDEIAAPFKSPNGPDVLRGAVEQAKTGLAGKTEALRNVWDNTTKGQHGSFDQFLMPATKKALGIPLAPAKSEHPDDIQAILKQYGH